jgi:nucleotide-binding universal stress UspA family protein
MYRRILVPLDGSELAEKALAEAQDLATMMKVPVHLLRVVDFTRLESYGPYGLAMEYTSFEPILSEETETAQTYLDEVKSRAEALGLTVTAEVRRGPVTREIVDAASEGDLLVMASHGRGGISRWLLGSVAEDVLRHSRVPILLIRAKEDDDDRENE